MFLFNTTFTVDDSELGWWQEWMRETYRSSIEEVSPASELSVYAIDATGDGGSRSYSAQWHCATLQDLGRVRLRSMSLCQKLLAEKGEKCLAFTTLMRRMNI